MVAPALLFGLLACADAQEVSAPVSATAWDHVPGQQVDPVEFFSRVNYLPAQGSSVRYTNESGDSSSTSGQMIIRGPGAPALESMTVLFGIPTGQIFVDGVYYEYNGDGTFRVTALPDHERETLEKMFEPASSEQLAQDVGVLATTSLVYVGLETLEGEELAHYRGELDFSGLTNEQLQITEEDRESAADVLTTPAVVDYWLDSERRLRRSESMSRGETVVLTYFDWDVPIRIRPPDNVVQDADHGADSAGHE